MAQQTVLKRSAASAAANTDTVLFTPAAGVRVKLLNFYSTNEIIAQTAGGIFELRFGANLIAAVGYETLAAPIGFTSKPAIIAHEIIGDGVTTVVARNLIALTSTSVAIYVVTYDANYLP